MSPGRGHALPRRVKGVIYDFDGTLADSIAVVVAATNAVLVETGRAPLPAAEVMAGMIWPTAPRMGHHAGVADPLHQHDLAQSFYAHANRMGPELSRSYPGITELTAAIRGRGLKQGVVSNNQGAFVRRVMTAIALDGDIGSAWGEEDVPAPKPDPRGVVAMAGILGVDVADCVYVGDTQGDAVTASAAGMAAVGVTWGIHTRAQLEQAPFAALIDTPDELLALLGH